LDDVLDGLLAAGDLDGAIVFARGKFALHENMRAFDETWRQLLESFSEGDDAVPLGFVPPFVVLVLPGLLGGDAELDDGGFRSASTLVPPACQ
jgi:hypothetical protein